jgi:hypothetical protein
MSSVSSTVHTAVDPPEKSVLAAQFPAKFSLALRSYWLLLLALFRAPVAQLDRASDYGSEGLGFDSLRVRHF